MDNNSQTGSNMGQGPFSPVAGSTPFNLSPQAQNQLAGMMPGAMPQPGIGQPNAQTQSQISFVSVIQKSNSVLVVLPTDATFDQVAGGLSLFMSLVKQKTVQIYSPSPMTVEYNRLIGVNKITSDMGNRNLIVRFTDYDAQNVERVSYDIDSGQFKLTVIPKSDANPPTKNQIDLSYEGVAVDTIVIIGGENELNFPVLKEQSLQGSNIIHVGLKQISLTSSKNYLSFTRIGSSISEIVYGLIRENQLFIDPDIATNLLMGVEEVVGDNFVGEGVTAETYYTFADLMQYGAKRHSNKGLAGNFPPGSIPGQMPQQNLQQAGFVNQPPMGQSQPQSQTQPSFSNMPFSQISQASQAPSQNVQNVNDERNPMSFENKEVKFQDTPPEEGMIDESQAPDDWKKPKIFKGSDK